MKEQQRALDNLIREYWEVKTDEEIGQLANPPVAKHVVKERRHTLNLKKKKWSTNLVEGVDVVELKEALFEKGYSLREFVELKGIKRSLDDLYALMKRLGIENIPAQRKPAWKGAHLARKYGVDLVELKKALFETGYSLREFAELKAFKGSLRSLYELAECLGVDSIHKQRKPEWKVFRLARQLGRPEFLNREWLSGEVGNLKVISDLAAKLDVTESQLRVFTDHFGLTGKSTNRPKVLNLVCATCGNSFQRRMGRMNGNAHSREKLGLLMQTEFYCKQRCFLSRKR